MSLRPPCSLPVSEPMAGEGEMTLGQAQAEAARCLSGHSCQGCELCLLICPDLAVTKNPDTGRPVIDLAFCKGCGLCANVCPKGAITMELDQA
ncbi:MAG: 4Fe-4S binding protein [Proteobacteria bacterium]|nr:4Fe-4S binding protein [Pseudomonadota bacterium]MBU1449565.1 4Fe-4S binding protein [Pseudomonadota bacterium]MBU2470574.1 4Fe-4S binding protein [Pseudomonadota bacterium]MBU2516862.1 4Fe-4S binding protein [Pseudomonadota bacterium]